MLLKYYLPINGNNLGFYFSSAIIIPQNYLKERLTDLQSSVSNYLILSIKPFTTSCDCALEMILTEEEIKSLQKQSNAEIYFFNTALPITRVSKIFFHNEEKMKRTISLAESASYIPERLIKIIVKNESSFIDEDNLIIEPPIYLDDNMDKINLFDRYLGGFAFMKLGGEEKFMDYSRNYFSTLGFFNKKIEEEIILVGEKIKLIHDEKYHGLFEKSDSQWELWIKLILGSPEEVFQYLNGKVRFSNNKFKKDTVIEDRKLYILAILANYGHSPNKSEQTDSLIKDLLTNKIYEDPKYSKYKEPITLFYGIHNGYNGFRKNYHFNESTQILKFELTSGLDYYTIESIYQYIFNKKFTRDLKYLHQAIPIYENQINKAKFKAFKILDKQIIYDIRPKSFIESINILFEKITYRKITASLSKSWQKKNSFVLIPEQIDILNNEFGDIIKEPLKDYVTILCAEMQDIYEEKLELQRKDFENELKIQLSKNIEILPEVIPISRDQYLIHEFYLKKLSRPELKRIATTKGILNAKDLNDINLINEIMNKIEQE